MDDPKDRAARYLRAKGTDAPPERLAASCRETFRLFEQLLAGLPPDRARQNPPAGGWSVREVVDHLILSHRPAIEQIAAARRGDDPGPAIAAHLTSAAGREGDFAALVAELRRVHAGLLEQIDALAQEPPSTLIPIAMVLKVDQEGRRELLEWTENLDAKAYAQGLRVHTLEHHRQVERILAALAA